MAACKATAAVVSLDEPVMPGSDTCRADLIADSGTGSDLWSGTVYSGNPVFRAVARLMNSMNLNPTMR